MVGFELGVGCCLGFDLCLWIGVGTKERLTCSGCYWRIGS